MFRDLSYTRREILQSAGGLAALTLPTLIQLRAEGGLSAGAPQAKACIIVYCWGGIGHQESWDPKPEALVDLRGEFSSIPTNAIGVRFCEHLPRLANHADQLCIVRSLHHTDGGHGSALYYNLTAHARPAGRAGDRNNWPSLAAMIARLQGSPAGTPAAIRLPYSMYDNGTMIPGQAGGWLGSDHDPILMRTPAGKPFGGVSRYTNRELDLKLRLKPARIADRQVLRERLERVVGTASDYDRLDRFRRMAADMLLSSPVKEAYDLEREDPRIRVLYGNHIGGQSMLLARRLVEAGVPVVQVCAGAGDLAGGSGDNWDTHRDHFAKMKRRLLPVFDRSVSALLTDLHQRGMLEETLVVLLTEFGRTPKINKNAGRDHHPAVYSVALAGGGVRGGQVYGSSDVNGARPAALACTPEDLHATVYQAMGINPRTELHDRLGRPYQICDGRPLPVF